MTLSEIANRLSVLITQMAVLINPISAILRLVGITAKEHTPYNIEGRVDTIADTVTSATFGNAALHADLLALLTAVTALGAPQQAFSPVTLPSTAPAGFFSNSALEIADACWIQPPTGYASGFDAPVLQTIQSVGYINYFTIPIGVGIFVLAGVNYAFKEMTVPSFTVPTFDPTNILVGETLLSNLTRQNPTWVVSYGEPPQQQVALTPTDGSKITWVTSIDESDWPRYYNAIYPAAAQTGGPVWPGTGLVTFGAVTALSNGLVVTGPMAGVIVTITSVPAPISYYPFGSVKSYVRAGAIVFTSDNGDSAFPLPFGPDDQLIMVTGMAAAASCSVRLASGIVGTIQPFTIP